MFLCIFHWLIPSIVKALKGLGIIEKLNLTCSLRVMITGVDRVEVSSPLSVLPGTEVYSCCTLSVQADCTPVQWTWNVMYSLHWEQRMSHGNKDPHNSLKNMRRKNVHIQDTPELNLVMSFVLCTRIAHGSLTWITCDEDIIGACQKMVRVSQPRIVPGVSTCHHCRHVITAVSTTSVTRSLVCNID